MTTHKLPREIYDYVKGYNNIIGMIAVPLSVDLFVDIFTISGHLITKR